MNLVRRHVTDEEAEHIIKVFKETLSYSKTSKITGWSCTTVKNYVTKLHLSTYKSVKKLNKEEINFVRETYVKNHNVKLTAKLTKHSEDTIRKYIEDLNVTHIKKLKKVVTKEDKKEMDNLYKKGYSFTKISKITGWSLTAVIKNIKHQKKTRLIPHNKTPAEYIRKLNIKFSDVIQVDPQTMKIINIYENVRAACKALSISHTSIYNAIKNNKIVKGYYWYYRYDYLKEKGSRRASKEEIQYIRNTYTKCKSIEKTIKITGWSRNTVHKYVKDLSCKSPSSSFNHRPVLKINKNTMQIVERYADLSAAAKLSNISISNICHCLKNDTNTAGGYIWRYENEYKKETLK